MISCPSKPVEAVNVIPVWQRKVNKRDYLSYYVIEVHVGSCDHLCTYSLHILPVYTVCVISCISLEILPHPTSYRIGAKPPPNDYGFAGGKTLSN
jgi:hypothetical protein